MSDRAELPATLRRLALRTPTLPPATTTNTLVVGTQRLAVVEPATPHADEQDRLRQLLDALRSEGREVVAILVTHHHSDHFAHAPALRDRLGVPVYAHAETADRLPFAVDRLLGHGDVVELDDEHALEAIHTPGHAPGHLVFRERHSNVAYVGDMVAGEGTILIDPDDAGDMGAYLQSLEGLIQLGLDAVVPSHGPVLGDPKAVFEHYIAHRLGREAKVLAAIAPAGSDFADVLAGAYDDTPRALWPLAARSLEAHLRKLEAEGRVTRSGSRVRRG